MTKLQRRIILCVVLALFTSVGLLHAQDSGITVVGSGLVKPVFEALNAAGTNASLSVTMTGTNDGLAQLCAGTADVALTTRTISADENKACEDAGVDYSEVLIAHDVLVFVVKADSAAPICGSISDLGTLFAPSSTVTNWNQFGTGNADLAVSLLAPAPESAAYATLDALLKGDGFRADVKTAASDADVIAAVSQDSTILGVAHLSAVTEGVRALQLNSDVVGCTDPSAASVEARSYPAAATYYAYVNRAALTKTSLTELLTFAGSEASAATIAAAGLTAPNSNIYTKNAAALAGTGEKHPYSVTQTSFQIPADAQGAVLGAGSAVAFAYLNTLLTNFQTQYTAMSVTLDMKGQTLGVQRLCNGEVDFAVVNSALTPEQQQSCTTNQINLFSVNLGYQAVVLVSSAQSAYLACMTPAQLSTAWGAASSKTANNLTMWNQVDASFPAEAMFLFAQPTPDHYADLVLTKAGVVQPLREDGYTFGDPAYRAAAVANVAGGMTYMSWADYQKVVAKGQTGIQLVKVGTDCASAVEPSEASIQDGSYPLTEGATLLVSEKSLTKVPVQSFVWYLLDDSNFVGLAQNGFVGANFGDWPGLRESLQAAFKRAAEAAATAAAVVTPEPTVEATPSS